MRLLEKDLFSSGLAGADSLPASNREGLCEDEGRDDSERRRFLRGLANMAYGSCIVTVTLSGLLSAIVVC